MSTTAPKPKVKHIGAGHVIQELAKTHEKEGFIEFAAVGITKDNMLICRWSLLSEISFAQKVGMIELLKQDVINNA